MAARRPPTAEELTLFMILNPDFSVQPMLVAPAATEGLVRDLSGEIRAGNVLTASASTPEEWKDSELRPCIHGRYGSIYGTGGQPRCLVFDFVPQMGATYRVTVSAEGRPTATAVTTIPGDFSVVTATATGDPPGTKRFDASWSRSRGAYRYLVALRAADPPFQTSVPDRKGWFAVTTDTSLSTVVSGKAAEELVGGGGPWYVDVYAVDKALYEYLTTGTDAALYPVPPLQNVKGGYGAVGSWVRRSMEIEPPE